MQGASELPCLPGFSFNQNIGRTNFRKNQNFNRVHDNIYFLTDKACAPKHSRYPSIYPRGEVPEIPSWIAYDGQRLMFKAYFQETVQEMRQAYNVRTVTISFFLEDGTIKIAEPPIVNSGLAQGILVKRQRIPMPDPVKYRYFDIIDLNIGKEPEMYGRVYKIVDCDRFTRVFLNRMGIPVPDPIEIPQDPYLKSRGVGTFAKKPYKREDVRGNFLKYDKKVLKFYAYWDDRDTQYGIVHDLEINYYLADHTIEVLEKIPPNSGRDCGSTFVKRMKIPKLHSGLMPLGASDPFTVLNVLGEDPAKCWLMVDSLNTGLLPHDYYKENELNIGANLNIFGRHVVITDMDPFTKEYYREQYGLEDFTPLQRPRNIDELGKLVERDIPPYNGYGTYEDSLGNCFSVIPKPPKTDFIKFLYYDKVGYDSHVLRFKAEMISDIPENRERHFIVRIFLIDNALSIYEVTKRNSGFKRCLFRKKMPMMLPNQDVYTNKKPRYYKPEDFYVGAIINLEAFIFKLTSADMYALRYMELHSDKFPKANVKVIMEKLRNALQPDHKAFLKEFDCCGVGGDVRCANDERVVEYAKFRNILCKYMGDRITEHELITLARHYSSHEKKQICSREFIRQLVHSELYRNLWNDLDRLEENLMYWDTETTGCLPREILYRVLRGCRIPLDPELLNSMLDHLKKREDGQLYCSDLLQFMNSKICPLPPALPINVKNTLWWASEKDPACGEGIFASLFLKDLNFKEEDLDEMKQQAISIKN